MKCKYPVKQCNGEITTCDRHSADRRCSEHAVNHEAATLLIFEKGKREGQNKEHELIVRVLREGLLADITSIKENVIFQGKYLISESAQTRSAGITEGLNRAQDVVDSYISVWESAEEVSDGG